MAQPPSVRPRTSLPKQFANFTNSTAGLDLTLRLIHALAIVAAEVSGDNVTVSRCTVAVSQLGLARRYLRFSCFIECFGRSYELLAGGSQGGTLSMMMELVESSCLGLYFLMEDFTMLHDMNIWRVSWYTPILLEANKFWFYAICISIARTVGQLFFGFGEGTQKKNKSQKTSEKKKKSEKPAATPSTAFLLKRLVVDSCDLTLPASFLGWIPLGNLGVGMAMTVSSVLFWPDLWVKLQPQSLLVA